jgi:hypothetical protein
MIEGPVRARRFPGPSQGGYVPVAYRRGRKRPDRGEKIPYMSRRMNGKPDSDGAGGNHRASARGR